MANKSPFRDYLFTVWYFRPSGKYYAGETLNLSCEVVKSAQPGVPDAYAGPYMYSAVRKILDMRPLPGLDTGEWLGPIVINCSEGYPILLQNSLNRP